MTFLNSCLKLLGTIVLVSVLALTFFPSKAFAFQADPFTVTNPTSILLAYGEQTLTLDGSVDIINDLVFGEV